MKKFSILLLIAVFSSCNQETVSKDKYDKAMAMALVQTSLAYSAMNSQIDLQGSWNSGFGTTTSSTTITTISARSGNKGIWLDDATTYSTCQIIAEYSNSDKYIIIQNPENNGACFSGDTNKGKYFKIVYFQDATNTNKYWYCNLNGTSSKSTAQLAKDITDTTTRTSPGTTGCGGFGWSWLTRKF